MAVGQVGNIHDVAAVGLKNLNGGATDSAGYSDPNQNTVTAARTRLAAISATTYTTAVLDSMTLNDMRYAIRLNDFASTIR